MSQNPSAAVGQVSADGQFRWDGQQWVPIPRGTREPTSWTRPMQLATAAVFVVETIFSLLTAALYINHASMLRALNAQGTSIPAGTSLDTVVTISVFFAWAVVVIFAVLQLVAALGSYLGWRWMFWAALVLFALGGIGGLTNLGYFVRPEASPVSTWAVIVEELFSLVSAAFFVWLLIAAIRFGPWAMKRPGT